jgi:hypothetical protein
VNDVPRNDSATEKLIFQAALFLCDKPQREEYLQVACQGDSAIRMRIDALLRAAEANDSFMRKPAISSIAAEPLWSTHSALETHRSHETGNIDCPNCRNSMELPGGETPEELICTSCGYSFYIDWQFDSRTSAVETARRLGRYELLGVVGTGAFGTVYNARDPELQRIVAIKIPRHGNVAGKDEVDRFLREARSVAQLRHPSIVSIYEVGTSDGLPYLVSEFVEGVTLADLLATKRPPPHKAAELVSSIADALQYAHDMGVIHRDIKNTRSGALRSVPMGVAPYWQNAF